MPQPPPAYVHLLPSLISPGALRGGVAVVVDVLRATTAMLHALAAGCDAVIPCGEVDEARRVAKALPAGKAILGGERGGVQIEGFDFGNSPLSYTPEICRGKTLVMTTTNGTRAILASLDADRVAIAAFVNLTATVEWLSRSLVDAPARPIHLVCAGTEGDVSVEDTLFAGAVLTKLAASGVEPANDAAVLAAAAWRDTLGRLEREPLSAFLALGRGGHNVLRLGFEADLGVAAQIDRLKLTAELRREPVRIIKTGDFAQSVVEPGGPRRLDPPYR